MPRYSVTILIYKLEIALTKYSAEDKIRVKSHRSGSRQGPILVLLSGYDTRRFKNVIDIIVEQKWKWVEWITRIENRLSKLLKCCMILSWLRKHVWKMWRQIFNYGKSQPCLSTASLTSPKCLTQQLLCRQMMSRAVFWCEV